MVIKRFWKVFIFLFLITFIIFNWNEVSWIFNYKVVFGLLSDFLKGSDRGVQKNEQNEQNKQNKQNKQYEYYEKENSLEIPKIQISAPLVFSESADRKKIYKALDRGVVHFPNSVLPGESGQTIILGHSAPPGWPKIKYDWVFSRLNELVEGDKIYVFFNNRKYEYIVIRKVFLEKGEEVSQNDYDLTNNKNMLILISCWPPGKDIRRIAIKATLIK